MEGWRNLSEYITHADPFDTDSLERHVLSAGETELFHYLLGNEMYRVRPPFAYAFRGVHPQANGRACTALDGSRVIMLVSAGDILGLLHEYGHAIHILKHPESEYWPIEKCEAWAFLSMMRAMRLKRGLEPAARTGIGRYLWACRREGTVEHRAGMRLAYRAAFSSFKLAEQQEFILNA